MSILPVLSTWLWEARRINVNVTLTSRRYHVLNAEEKCRKQNCCLKNIVLWACICAVLQTDMANCCRPWRNRRKTQRKGPSARSSTFLNLWRRGNTTSLPWRALRWGVATCCTGVWTSWLNIMVLSITPTLFEYSLLTIFTLHTY